jgi:hypothetical protein
MVVVVGVVWARRRWTRRRVVDDGTDATADRAAPPTQAEAEALLREQEIIKDLEARFHQ